MMKRSPTRQTQTLSSYINRFPTWQVWKLLHGFISMDMYLMLQRALRIEHPPSGVSRLSNVWTWVAISFVANLTTTLGSFFYAYSSVSTRMGLPVFTSLNFLTPIFITFVTLRYALRVSGGIAQQREIGNYDLFALLPVGEFTNVLNIARSFRHPLQGMVVGIVSALVLAVLTWLVITNAPATLASSLLAFNTVIYYALPVLVRGIASFIDYLQSFVAATLIAILVSQNQRRDQAQIWMIGSFLALQLALYIIIAGFSWQFGNMIVYSATSNSRASFIFLSYSFALIFQNVILIIVREVVNAALWRLVKRRMDV